MEMKVAKSKIDHQDESIKSVLRNRGFLYLWTTSIFTGLSLSIYLISETWYIINELKQPTFLGIILMLTTLPRVLFMSLGGVLADRLRKSRIMLFSTVSRSVLLLSMIVVLFFGLLDVWTLGIFALLFGVLDAFFWPANHSMLPSIVKKKQLLKANSLLQTTNQLSMFIGPVLAGFLIKFGSFITVFTITALLLIISSILIRFIKENEMPKEKGEISAWIEFKEGISYVKGIPFLVTISVSSILINLLFVGPINIGLPLIVDQTLKGDVLDLSLLESTFAIGMVLGAFLTGILNIKKRRPIISLILIGLISICNIFLSQITILWQGMIILIITGICLSISNTIFPSLVQEMTDPKMIGRVQSLMSTASMGFIPLSYAFVSFLVSISIPIHTIMVYANIILFAFVLFVLIKVKVMWTID